MLRPPRRAEARLGGAELSGIAGADHARQERNKLQRVAAVERQLFDALGVHQLGDRTGGGDYRRRRGVDLDDFGNLADFESRMERPLFADREFDGVDQEFAEACGLDGEPVGAARDIDEIKEALR